MAPGAPACNNGLKMTQLASITVTRHPLQPAPELEAQFKGHYYLIKAERKNQKPLQWRRVLLHSRNSFSDLHCELLQAFDLSNDHLATFYGYNRSKTNIICGAWYAYGIFAPALCLADVIDDHEGVKLLYSYNLKEPFDLLLTVERVVTERSEISSRVAWANRV